MNKKLDIKGIFFQAADLVAANALQLLKYGAPMIILGVASSWINESGSGGLGSVVQLIVSIAYAMAVVAATVFAHRVFLLPAAQNAELKPVRWSMRETRFVGWSLAISLSICVFMIPFSLLLFNFVPSASGSYIERNIIQFILWIPLYYCVARWSMVLPATAIDMRGLDLAWSWRISKGNGWRVFVLLGLLPMGTEMLFSLVPAVASPILFVIEYFVWLVVAVFEICLLSLCYCELCKFSEDAGSAQLQV